MRGLTTAPEAGMRSEPSSMLGQVAVLIICNVCGNWGKGCNPAIPRPVRGLTTAARPDQRGLGSGCWTHTGVEGQTPVFSRIQELEATL